MQSKKKKLNYIPDVNKYTGRTRTLAVCINKYLKNNETLTKIWYPIIDYDKKPFELNPSVEKQIKELQSCIKKQETTFKILRREVQRDIENNKKKQNEQKKIRWDIEYTRRSLKPKKKEWIIKQFWYIPDEFKHIEINKSKWYVSEEYQKMYQYLRPFPDNLIRRWYSTDYTQETLPDWRIITHAPEWQIVSNKKDWYTLSWETINYWIASIHNINSAYIVEQNNYKQDKTKLLNQWFTKEQLEIKHKETIEKYKQEMIISRDNLYNIINNPRNPNRETEWDYDPSQHWVIHTFIWLIYY